MNIAELIALAGGLASGIESIKTIISFGDKSLKFSKEKLDHLCDDFVLDKNKYTISLFHNDNNFLQEKIQEISLSGNMIDAIHVGLDGVWPDRAKGSDVTNYIKAFNAAKAEMIKRGASFAILSHLASNKSDTQTLTFIDQEMTDEDAVPGRYAFSGNTKYYDDFVLRFVESMRNARIKNAEKHLSSILSTNQHEDLVWWEMVASAHNGVALSYLEFNNKFRTKDAQKNISNHLLLARRALSNAGSKDFCEPYIKKMIDYWFDNGKAFPRAKPLSLVATQDDAIEMLKEITVTIDLYTRSLFRLFPDNDQSTNKLVSYELHSAMLDIDYEVSPEEAMMFAPEAFNEVYKLLLEEVRSMSRQRTQKPGL